MIEEPFRDNPLFWEVLLREGPDAAGVGLFTLTQLVSLPLILLALYAMLVIGPEGPGKRDKLQRRARGR